MRNPFKKRKIQNAETFDPALYTPVIRASVCTGEKVAGFRGQDGRHSVSNMTLTTTSRRYIEEAKAK